VFTGICVSVAGAGFQRVDVDAGDLIVDRGWREVIDDPWPVGPTVRTIAAEWSTSPSTVGRLGITVEGFGL
jgi:hypothetical protein